MEKSYKLIQEIANGVFSLDILDERIDFLDYNISIAQYLFYPRMFDRTKFPAEFFIQVDQSIIAIKAGIKALAVDFSQRDEYNAYKHGIRIFPTYKSIHFVDAGTMEQRIAFDLSNSVSYYTFNDKLNEAKITTKLFDSERDFLMTRLGSNLIFTLIHYRDIMVNMESRKKMIKLPFAFLT